MKKYENTYIRFRRAVKDNGLKLYEACDKTNLHTATIHGTWKAKAEAAEEPYVSPELADRIAAVLGGTPEDWETHPAYLTGWELQLIDALHRDNSGYLQSVIDGVLEYADIRSKKAVIEARRGGVIPQAAPPIDDDDD